VNTDQPNIILAMVKEFKINSKFYKVTL